MTMCMHYNIPQIEKFRLNHKACDFHNYIYTHQENILISGSGCTA
jgi:hypothetical protein